MDITTEFSDLGLAEPVLKALTREGYTTPTPIQAQAIPPLLQGADLLGIAQTGTGKTAAFALPTLTRLLTRKQRPIPKGCRVLVLSPTRELAAQIAESFQTYGKYMGIRVAMICGGVGHRPQIMKMQRGVDVLVATPGRLIDHMDRGNVHLHGTEVFVLDEADQMLDLGFLQPIKRIAGAVGPERQNLFFSATWPKEIAKLADALLNDPVKVSVAPVSSTAERVSQRVIHIEKSGKTRALSKLFKDETMTRTLVFTRTKRGADRVAKALGNAKVEAAAIHGNKTQGQRDKALKAFKNGHCRVLVATDIASRGIDVSGVSHVVNFELPEVPEAYVHRIGRTARAGAEGIAISFCDATERGLLRAIEQLTKQDIEAEDMREDTSESLEVIHKKPAKAKRGGGARSAGAGRGRGPQKAPRGAARSRPGQKDGYPKRDDRAETTPAKRRAKPRRAPAGAGSVRSERAERPTAEKRDRRGSEARGSRPPRRNRSDGANSEKRDDRGGERSGAKPAGKKPARAGGKPGGKSRKPNAAGKRTPTGAPKAKRPHRGKRPTPGGAPSGASRMKRKPGGGAKRRA